MASPVAWFPRRTAGDASVRSPFYFCLGKGWLAHTPSATKCWEGVFYERILLLQRFEPMNFTVGPPINMVGPSFRTPTAEEPLPKETNPSKGHREASLGHLRWLACHPRWCRVKSTTWSCDFQSLRMASAVGTRQKKQQEWRVTLVAHT